MSLVGLLPKNVRADGEYWGEFYRWHYDQGHLGYLDSRRPFAPFLFYGVAETMPVDGIERSGVHNVLADHPLIRHSRRVWMWDVEQGGTPWYLLPHKAAYIFWNKGPVTLLREINAYLHWRSRLRQVSVRVLLRER